VIFPRATYKNQRLSGMRDTETGRPRQLSKERPLPKGPRAGPFSSGLTISLLAGVTACQQPNTDPAGVKCRKAVVARVRFYPTERRDHLRWTGSSLRMRRRHIGEGAAVRIPRFT
jgi:hypothetical protein